MNNNKEDYQKLGDKMQSVHLKSKENIDEDQDESSANENQSFMKENRDKVLTNSKENLQGNIRNDYFQTPQRNQNDNTEKEYLIKSNESQFDEKTVEQIIDVIKKDFKVQSPQSDDFIEFQKSFSLYVDKSNLIKEIVNLGSLYIIAPQRWGKSMNISMLRHFFQPSGNDQNHYIDGKYDFTFGNQYDQYFKNLNIARWEDYNKYQGKIPVIFLNFKTITQFETIEQLEDLLHDEITKAYQDHNYILKKIIIDSLKIFQPGYVPDYQIDIMDLITSYQLLIQEKNLKDSLTDQCIQYFYRFDTKIQCKKRIDYLKDLLFEHYECKSIIVLVDEFDKPMISKIKQMFDQNNYDQNLLINICKATTQLISGFVKGDSGQRSQVILTGLFNTIIKDISSSVSTMRNISLTSLNYSTITKYFGFDEIDIQTILDRIFINTNDSKNAKQEIRKKLKYWYNGQNIGNYEMYTPSSVINYLTDLVQQKNNKLKFQTYWVQTQTNNLLKSILNILSENELHQTYFAKLKDIAEQKEVFLAYKNDVSLVDLVCECNKNSIIYQNLFSHLLINGGYLAIKQKCNNIYGFPANEVKIIAQQIILNAYLEKNYESQNWNQFYEQSQNLDFKNDSIKKIAEKFEQLFNIASKNFEQTNESMIELILFAQFINSHDYDKYKITSQIHSEDGIIDTIIYFDDRIDIYELKYKQTVVQFEQIEQILESAITQIISKKYLKNDYQQIKYESSQQSIKNVRAISLLVTKLNNESKFICQCKEKTFKKFDLEQIFDKNENNEISKQLNSIGKSNENEQSLRRDLLFCLNKVQPEEKENAINQILKQPIQTLNIEQIKSLNIQGIGQKTQEKIYQIITQSNKPNQKLLAENFKKKIRKLKDDGGGGE